MSRHRAYYAAHREERSFRERQNAHTAKYYAGHREQILQQQKAYHATCRDERRKRDAAYYAAHREDKKVYQAEYNRTRAHGITRLIRDWMYESQDRACAGCRTPMVDEDLQIDHDHSCCPGRESCGACVRGLVCRSCNARDVLAGAGIQDV